MRKKICRVDGVLELQEKFVRKVEQRAEPGHRESGLGNGRETFVKVVVKTRVRSYRAQRFGVSVLNFRETYVTNYSCRPTCWKPSDYSPEKNSPFMALYALRISVYLNMFTAVQLDRFKP